MILSYFYFIYISFIDKNIFCFHILYIFSKSKRCSLFIEFLNTHRRLSQYAHYSFCNPKSLPTIGGHLADASLRGNIKSLGKY